MSKLKDGQGRGKYAQEFKLEAVRLVNNPPKPSPRVIDQQCF